MQICIILLLIHSNYFVVNFPIGFNSWAILHSQLALISSEDVAIYNRYDGIWLPIYNRDLVSMQGSGALELKPKIAKELTDVRR